MHSENILHPMLCVVWDANNLVAMSVRCMVARSHKFLWIFYNENKSLYKVEEYAIWTSKFMKTTIDAGLLKAMKGVFHAIVEYENELVENQHANHITQHVLECAYTDITDIIEKQCIRMVNLFSILKIFK